ncbi:MAG: flagellar motor protein MotB [Acidobacteriaceae bacterium]
MSKKKHPEHVNHERWLVSYADFITLLFAFFVVLFASSQADKKKQVKVARAMQSAFSNMGVFEPHSKTPPLTDNGGSGADIAGKPNPMNLATMPEQSSPLATGRNAQAEAQPGWSSTGLENHNPDDRNPGPKRSAKAILPSKSLADLKRDLDLLLARPIGSHQITVHIGDGGLVISLREAGFFDSGSANVHSGALPIIQSIATELIPTHYDLRIEGHTDNIPIHTAQFDSNWDLSTTRSVRIARIFLQQRSLDPKRLSAAGYAEFHPVASNATDAGRARNRRVDIVVLPRSPAE